MQETQDMEVKRGDALGILFIFLGLTFFLLGYLYYQFPGFRAELKSASSFFSGNHLMIIATAIIALANIVLIIITYTSSRHTKHSLDLAEKANRRSEMIFLSQKKPLIDVTPISIKQRVGENSAETAISFINYSGFPAFNIGYDLKFGGGWIGEWIKANEQQGEGVIPDKLYT